MLWSAHALRNLADREMLLRVVVEETMSEADVVTVDKTSKIDKSVKGFER